MMTIQSVKVNTEQRRRRLREALIASAERAVAKEGLPGVRARGLADEAGCAVGAIYNAIDDLDELVLLVNSRTLAALEHELRAVSRAAEVNAGEAPAPVAGLVRLALAYLDFAAANTLRWRALFDHRLPPGRDVPLWYRDEQQRLFHLVDEPLRTLQPDASPKRRALLARALFSAVHGIVVLGLEEKLGEVPLPALREQITLVVTAIGRGLTSSD